MDVFDLEKTAALTKDDKSSRGSWDSQIQGLCDTINSSRDYFTTSSCSGRIVLLKDPFKGVRQENIWLFSSHQAIDPEDLMQHLPGEGSVWFKEEPFILHIACRTIDHAKVLLNLIRDLGFKRCGMISLKKNTVEIIGMEKVDTLVAQDGTQLVSDKYLGTLIGIANQKLSDNWKDITRITQKFKESIVDCEKS